MREANDAKEKSRNTHDDYFVEPCASCEGNAYEIGVSELRSRHSVADCKRMACGAGHNVGRMALDRIRDIRESSEALDALETTNNTSPHPTTTRLC